MQGQSLAPLMSAEDPSRPEGWRRRPAISERTRSAALRDPETANGVAIVWEGWKLIHNKERDDPNIGEWCEAVFGESPTLQ